MGRAKEHRFPCKKNGECALLEIAFNLEKETNK